MSAIQARGADTFGALALNGDTLGVEAVGGVCDKSLVRDAFSAPLNYGN